MTSLVWFRWRLYWHVCRLLHRPSCPHAIHRRNGCDCGRGVDRCHCRDARMPPPFADFTAD